MVQEGKENFLRTFREQVFIRKSELARKAGISPTTIDRIENSRLATKKKIILALGLELSEGKKIFEDEH